MNAVELASFTGFFIYAYISYITLKNGHVVGWVCSLSLVVLALLSSGQFTSGVTMRGVFILAFQISFLIYMHNAEIKGKLK